MLPWLSLHAPPTKRKEFIKMDSVLLPMTGLWQNSEPLRESIFQQGVDSEEPWRQLVTSVYLTAAYVSAKHLSLPASLLAWSRDAPIQVLVSCIGPILSLCPCIHRHKTLHSKTTITALLSGRATTKGWKTFKISNGGARNDMWYELHHYFWENQFPLSYADSIYLSSLSWASKCQHTVVSLHPWFAYCFPHHRLNAGLLWRCVNMQVDMLPHVYEWESERVTSTHGLLRLTYQTLHHPHASAFCANTLYTHICGFKGSGFPPDSVSLSKAALWQERIGGGGGGGVFSSPSGT